MKKGKFIVLEGGEGSGKGMCINYLKEQLRDKDIIFTREPGGTPIGEAIRDIMMRKDFTEMTSETEIFLCCAFRHQHIHEKIKPAIANGTNVISDRFYTSTIAYNLFRKNNEKMLDEFMRLNAIAIDGTNANHVIYLDVTPEEGLRRKKGSDDGIATRFDEEALDTHKKVREGYLYQVAHPAPETTWHVVETEKHTPEEVKEIVLKLVKDIIG
jgi:dTMP kinase